MLTEEESREIESEFQHYPQKRGACIEALQIVQRHRGWISDDLIGEIAGLLEMSAEELDSVATFYNHIFRKPVGRHVIRICDSVSCWIMGYDRLREEIGTRLGIRLGQTSKDGKFTLLPVPCLGTCDHAPALMIDDDLYRDLQPERVGEILAACDRGNG